MQKKSYETVAKVALGVTGVLTLVKAMETVYIGVNLHKLNNRLDECKKAHSVSRDKYLAWLSTSPIPEGMNDRAAGVYYSEMMKTYHEFLGACADKAKFCVKWGIPAKDVSLALAKGDCFVK